MTDPIKTIAQQDSTTPRCLVIMAGGTGGHVFPGLAVAHKMQALGWQIHWIGTADKMEAQLVPKHGFTIHYIRIAGVRGKNIITKLSTPFMLLRAWMQARKLLQKIHPDVVLGMGGYASGPGGLAAYTLGIPIVIHEQNAVFGMTNRYLAKIASAALTGFNLSNTNHEHKAPKHCQFVGNPIRAEFYDVPPIEESQTHTNILIVGGSLGALALNQHLPQILKTLSIRHKIAIKHQTGKGKLQQVEHDYGDCSFAQAVEFIDDMQADFAWADLIICRAGALTVAEVAGAGRAAIFVPLPIAVDDHQTQNANILSSHGAAVTLAQADLPQQLPALLESLCSDRSTLQNMGRLAKDCAIQDATAKVARVLIELTPNNSVQEKQ